MAPDALSVLLKAIESLATLSPTAIFAFFWYMEKRRSDRLEEQQKQLLQNIAAMNEAWLRVFGARTGGKS